MAEVSCSSTLIPTSIGIVRNTSTSATGYSGIASGACLLVQGHFRVTRRMPERCPRQVSVGKLSTRCRVSLGHGSALPHRLTPTIVGTIYTRTPNKAKTAHPLYVKLPQDLARSCPGCTVAPYIPRPLSRQRSLAHLKQAS